MEYQKALEIQEAIGTQFLDGGNVVQQYWIGASIIKVIWKEPCANITRHWRFKNAMAPNSLTVATSYNNIGSVLYSSR